MAYELLSLGCCCSFCSGAAVSRPRTAARGTSSAAHPLCHHPPLSHSLVSPSPQSQRRCGPKSSVQVESVPRWPKETRHQKRARLACSSSARLPEARLLPEGADATKRGTKGGFGRRKAKQAKGERGRESEEHHQASCVTYGGLSTTRTRSQTAGSSGLVVKSQEEATGRKHAGCSGSAGQPSSRTRAPPAPSWLPRTLPLPAAAACAVSGSVSVSAPSSPGLG